MWLNRCINCRFDNVRIDNIAQYGIINSTDNTNVFLFPFDNYFYNLYISRCGSVIGNQDYCGFNTFGGNTYLYDTRIEFCSGGNYGGGAMILGVGGGVTYVYGLTTVGNRATGSSRAITTGRSAYGTGTPVGYITNWKYSETLPASIYSDLFNQKIISINDNDSGNTVITTDGGTITTNTTIVRPGGSNKSWRMSLLSTARRFDNPLYQKIENIYVTANKTYTASIYMYRTSNDVQGSFNLLIPMLRGITPQSATTTAASLSAWEKLSLEFTPTQDGFVWFSVRSWLNTSSLTQSVYWTDFDITPRVSTNITAGNYSAPSSEGAYAASTSFETSHPFC